jgi:lysophospholipase L1-like esterase
VSSLNQGDMIHPTAEGQQRMADIVWKTLEPILRRAA